MGRASGPHALRDRDASAKISMTNRTARCRHGMAIGLVRCPACSPRPADEERVSEARPRSVPKLRFRIGEEVAGVQIISRDIDDFVALCGCGKEFGVSRTTLANKARGDGIARCWECAKRESRRAFEAGEKKAVCG